MKAKDMRKGTVLVLKGQLYSVMDFNHHTPGNLRAMVQCKLRNLQNGTQTEQRFSSTEDLETADVFQQKGTFLYSDTNGYHFMNGETYEEISISEGMLGDGRFFLKEGMEVQLSMHEENPIGIQLPMTVTLTVTDTEPGIKGATATNSPKPARTETGLQLTVPQFINVGEEIIVKTDTGEYLSRA